MPLKHYVIALFIAAIAGCSFWAWRIQKATESASAVLAFDPTLAQHVDPGFASAIKPAIALADSILNDQAIAELVKHSHASSSTDANQIGEFRSGLELTQPSSSLLRVRFLDSDPGDSAANANAVAQALAAWAPSQAAAPAADAQPRQAAQPDASAGTTAAETRSQENHPASAPSLALHSLSGSLGEIGAQLSKTDRDLDLLAADSSAGHLSSSNPQSAYREYRQQQLLKTQVNAAEKKFGDLREQYGKGNADPNVKGRLTSIQQALDSILRGGEPAAQGFKAVGTSASQLSRERSQLSLAISVINQQRQAIDQAKTANSASDGSSQAPSPPASATPSTPQSSSSPPQQQPSPSADSAAPSAQPPEHPLSVVRLASPTPLPPLWPPILVGFACGLVYLCSAALAHHRAESEENYDEEERVYPQRFITPDEWADPPNEHLEAANQPIAQTTPADAETTPGQREPFAFFAAPKESPPPRRTGFLWDENGGASLGDHQEAPAEAGRPASPEKTVETVDPLADQIRKSLSQTEIGRMFEGTNREAGDASLTEKTGARKP
jgi:hypothetical protein